MKLAALAVLVLSAGIAHANPGPVDPYDDAPRAERRHQRGRMLRQALVQQFDRDGDGRLAPQERKQAARALHRLAKRLQHGQRGGKPGAKRDRLIRRFDLDGDGNLGPGELPPRVRERLRRLDHNGDGWIQNNELP